MMSRDAQIVIYSSVSAGGAGTWAGIEIEVPASESNALAGIWLTSCWSNSNAAWRVTSTTMLTGGTPTVVAPLCAGGDQAPLSVYREGLANAGLQAGDGVFWSSGATSGQAPSHALFVGSPFYVPSGKFVCFRDSTVNNDFQGIVSYIEDRR